VIQQALSQEPSKLYEPRFSAHSYGSGPRRNAHQALRKCKGYITEGYGYAVDMDLKFSYACVAAMVLSTGTILANSSANREPSTGLYAQISKMLSVNSFSDTSSDVTTQVRFTLNGEGEIVVLSVATESENLERFVKNRLNYKKVKISNVKEGKLYTIAVRIVS